MWENGHTNKLKNISQNFGQGFCGYFQYIIV